MDAGNAAMQVNWLAVIVAALSGFALGGLWYGPLFGRAWMAASGMTEERARAASMGRIYGSTLLLNIVAAVSLAMFIGAGDVGFGVFAGFMTGLTFVSVGLGITYLFEQRPMRLWLINAGYQTLFFTVMGAILGAWH